LYKEYIIFYDLQVKLRNFSVFFTVKNHQRHSFFFSLAHKKRFAEYFLVVWNTFVDGALEGPHDTSSHAPRKTLFPMILY